MIVLRYQFPLKHLFLSGVTKKIDTESLGGITKADNEGRIRMQHNV